MTTQNLNPNNLADINEALQLKPNHRLWFFLHEAIPTAQHDEMLCYDQPLDTFTAMSCIATDMLYQNSTNPTSFDNANETITNLKAYIPLIQSCYMPYEYHVEPMPQTAAQRRQLVWYKERGKCTASLTKKCDNAVPAIVQIIIGGNHGINKTAEVYLNS